MANSYQILTNPSNSLQLAFTHRTMQVLEEAFLIVFQRTDIVLKSNDVGLTLHASALANLCRETSLDGGDRSSGTTRVARDEVQPVLALVEFGID